MTPFCSPGRARRERIESQSCGSLLEKAVFTLQRVNTANGGVQRRKAEGIADEENQSGGVNGKTVE